MIIILSQGSTPSADFCRNLKFLQKSAERPAPYAEILNFYKKATPSAIPAEICRKVCTFLQKFKFLQKGTPFCRFCKNLKFLQIYAERLALKFFE